MSMRTLEAGQDDDVRRLPADPRSVAEARRFVRECLVAWSLDQLIDDAALIVSELAANAVVHAHSSYEVRMTRTGRVVRLEVGDAGSGAPRTGSGDPSLTSGRGLLIVGALAADWGVRRDAAGKTVWAELVG